MKLDSVPPTLVRLTAGLLILAFLLGIFIGDV
jgi:hypothetical protein